MTSRIMNRPSEAQATVLRWLREGGSPRGGAVYRACAEDGWVDMQAAGFLTRTGLAALAASVVRLTPKEHEALAILLGGPLFWCQGGAWAAAPDPTRPTHLTELDPRVATVVIQSLLGRRLIQAATARSFRDGSSVWIAAAGLDALGVVAPVPLPEGAVYTEGTGPKIRAWMGTPPPGWRPGLAAPDIIPPPSDDLGHVWPRGTEAAVSLSCRACGAKPMSWEATQKRCLPRPSLAVPAALDEPDPVGAGHAR